MIRLIFFIKEVVRRSSYNKTTKTRILSTVYKDLAFVIFRAVWSRVSALIFFYPAYWCRGWILREFIRSMTPIAFTWHQLPFEGLSKVTEYSIQVGVGFKLKYAEGKSTYEEIINQLNWILDEPTCAPLHKLALNRAQRNRLAQYIKALSVDDVFKLISDMNPIARFLSMYLCFMDLRHVMPQHFLIKKYKSVAFARFVDYVIRNPHYQSYFIDPRGRTPDLRTQGLNKKVHVLSSNKMLTADIPGLGVKIVGRKFTILEHPNGRIYWDCEYTVGNTWHSAGFGDLRKSDSAIARPLLDMRSVRLKKIITRW
jgi:hypothetical protein